MSPLAAIEILRPKHWIKNFFVFAPLIFADFYKHIDKLPQVVGAFALFCLAASAVYIFNDIRDLEEDRRHPVKSKKRPIAKGTLTVTQAYGLLAVVLVFLAVGTALIPHVLVPIALYLVLNILYTFWLKREPVLDIMLIAAFFVLRVYAGSEAAQVELSLWMLITTMALSLFLASVKRRQEFISSGSSTRQVLGSYSLSLIDQYIALSATCSLLFYSLFVVTIRHHLIVTVPFVLFGLLRYMYLVHMQGDGESPTNLVTKDKQLILAVLGWLAGCIYFIKG